MRENEKKSEFQERATLAADSYQELARAFSSYVTEAEEEKKENKVLPAIIDAVCEACPNCVYCWEDVREVCEDAFSYVAGYAEKTGHVGKDMLPAFFEECPAGDRIVEEWNRVLYRERVKRAAFQQMMEGKEALVRQLEETANCFRRMSSEEEDQKRKMSEEEKRALGLYLKAYHIKVKSIFPSATKGKAREWAMTLSSTSRRGVSVRLLERVLSEWFGVPVKEMLQQSRMVFGEEELVFREEPMYFALTGVARSVKKEQETSGDAFSFFYEKEEELTMILSDGMGSGEAASKESEAVLGLLEQMLLAGFPEETAIRLLNSVLALRMEPRSFATLDISRINLYLGTCEFIKIGGAATYIKRGRQLKKIETKTLPIGMIQQVDYNSLRKKLYDGDCIIMMSDGVLEVIPETERENFLSVVIGEDAEQKPQVIAGRILSASLMMQGYEPKDDMTVLVCGIFERKNN